MAIGLRSSCAASDTRARWRRWAASSRASMSFSVTARLCTSSRATGTGSVRPRAMAVPVMSCAPRRSSSIGRSAAPVTSQVAVASSRNSGGAPNTTARVTAARLSRT